VMMDRDDGRLHFALKSRGLFYKVVESAPLRAARVVRRPLRGRADGSG